MHLCAAKKKHVCMLEPSASILSAQCCLPGTIYCLTASYSLHISITINNTQAAKRRAEHEAKVAAAQVGAGVDSSGGMHAAVCPEQAPHFYYAQDARTHRFQDCAMDADTQASSCLKLLPHAVLRLRDTTSKQGSSLLH